MTEAAEGTTQKMVTVTIDEIKVTVPEGTYVVDAAITLSWSRWGCAEFV
jgi:hypothetical protein